VDTPKTIIRHVSLCSGYGGIDIGLRRVLPACRTIAYVEIEAFACANLVAKMEAGELDAAPIWTDLKTLPHEVFQSGVDIISGGYPCQPFSAAGQRKGKEDPRHLWPFIQRAIGIIRPRYCFFENVEGHLTLGFKDVCHDLGELGYQLTAGIFSAAECGAPHQRKRVFILAHANECGGKQDWFAGKLWASRVEQSSCNRWPSRPGEAQQEWEEPRVTGDSRATEFKHEIKSKLGRATPGTASGVDATANRVDRLRLLGNGVVPATCEVAFRTLYAELVAQNSLTNKEKENTNDNNRNNK